MKTDCPKCGNYSVTNIKEDFVKHDYEFVFVCHTCHHSFGAKMIFHVSGLPKHAEAFSRERENPGGFIY